MTHTHTASLKITSPAPREIWQTLFETDSEAVPYQHPAWFDCACEIGNYQDVSRLYETLDGHQYILPLVRRHGLPEMFTPAASMPNGWGMGGLLGNAPIEAQELNAILDDLAQLPFPRLSIRPNPRSAPVWTAVAAQKGIVAVPRRAHVLDLEGGFERVWEERFQRKTRTAVRKAERQGVVVERDTTGRLIPVFYKLLQRSFDRWSKQQHEPRLLTHLRGNNRDPLRKFQAIAQHLGQACHTWVAWVDGQPAAAMLVLQYHNVNDARAAMDKEVAARTGANELLQKLAIEEACQAGCRYYHLGESGESASLSRYKEKFGALPFSYAEYHLERLPITALDKGLRSIVKKAIGFKDT